MVYICKKRRKIGKSIIQSETQLVPSLKLLIDSLC